ncbi:hypothetical protein K2X85_09025 [bacterium]|nr:hypothetical protein [bacterium]
MSRAVVASLILLSSSVAWSQPGSLFDIENSRVAPTPKKVKAKPAPGKAVETSDEVRPMAYPLSKENGPVLIKVASFIGEPHLLYAEALAQELRDRYRLSSYVFRYQQKMEGSMSDEDAAAFEKQFQVKPRRLVPLTDPPLNFVVLVGDFASMDDPLAQKTLARLRKMEIQSIPEKIWEQYRMSAIEDAKGNSKKNHPLSSAMLVPNPHPQGRKFQKSISPELARMIAEINTSSPYSVYENPHPYTLAVAQFGGTTVFGSNDKEKGLAAKIFGGADSPLSHAAQQAIGLADALRKLGWEAYVFHGQYASIVCVGGFPELADLKDPQMKDLRYRVMFMDQHPDVMAFRQKIAEIKLADMTLSPNAELMLTPRPPRVAALAPLAE